MMTDIYKNRFVQKIINNGVELFKRYPLTVKDLANLRKGSQPDNWRRKDPYVRYNGDVHSSFCRITETLDDLRAVQIFLRQYPYSKTLTKNKISRIGYVTYHIEVYFLKVASLRDKLAILINDVYQLGLPEKRLTVDLLSEMQQMKNTECIRLLKEFSKAINNIIAQKNLITHRCKYSDEELSELEFYELIENGSTKYKLLVKLQTRSYISKKLKLFKQNQVVIENFIDTFLLCLLKEFETRCNIISHKNNN